MRIQFGTMSILLVMAIVAMALGGTLAWGRIVNFRPESDLIRLVVVVPFTAPLWLPFVFVGYAIGRKSLSVKLVATLAIAQLLAVGVCYAIEKIF